MIATHNANQKVTRAVLESGDDVVKQSLGEHWPDRVAMRYNGFRETNRTRLICGSSIVRPCSAALPKVRYPARGR